MLSGWVILLAAFIYILLLFAVASFGDRQARHKRAGQAGRPFVHALSLAIYCTSWTYFGGVGLASQKGLEYLGIYIGPILVFTLGMPLIKRITQLAKAEKLTSVADFVAARYGKNPAVAMIVAVIALIGSVPYIALQLKAVSGSLATIADPQHTGFGSGNFHFVDLALVVALVMAGFSIMFGTRHADATEHQDGLIFAVAMESLVKLIAFATIGLTVLFVLFDGPVGLLDRAQANLLVQSALAYETPVSRWLILTLLSSIAILLLPRQFHVAVVENRTAPERKAAGLLLPLYLIAINLFVLPVAAAGLITFGGVGDADLYVLTLPIAHDLPVVTLITFIGGFSAATAMIIVESVALSIMISNDIVLPLFLRRKLEAVRHDKQVDFTRTILRIRRFAILAVLLLAYGYYRLADSESGLASIGLLAFAAIAQVAPAMFGGLIWHRANARGAILGMLLGFAAWAYLLFLPSLGASDYSGVPAAVLHFLIPGIGIFSGPDADPLVNATLFSLALNILAFILGSLSRNARPAERLQAGIFVKRRARAQFATRGWQTRARVGDLKATLTRYLGAERMARSFAHYERTAGRKFHDNQPADMAMIHFCEQLLGGAIGSSSARLVLSLILQKREDTDSETAWLLDQASEALHHNQDVLHTALAQMDQGIAVFDRNGRLSVWNRRFRHLLDLPEQAGQVGFPLGDIVALIGGGSPLPADEQIRVFGLFQRVGTSFALTLQDSGRIIEVRINAMPDEGFVTTLTDISDRVAADRALKQANETLEQRVSERTEELTRVNLALAEARVVAEEANFDKTRFFAAASHDILQPLNAARLYSSALIERLEDDSGNATLVRNVDSALGSVEAILGAVLDISRLDTGAMQPRLADFSLDELLRTIATDYAPMAAQKGLHFVVMPTSLKVRSDPHLLRRLVQNLVSNAIKYTLTGTVLIGARRRGDRAIIEVHDSGIGIPQSKFGAVFKEFERLDEGARTAAGLGLGLSIVDRISRVLDHPVMLTSPPGRGTVFRVGLPIAASAPTLVPAPEEAPRQVSSQGLHGLHVLLIDNEPAIIEAMTLLLEGWGCSVSHLQSVGETERLRLRKGPVPDAVIADYHLGDGTGIEAILALRGIFSTSLPAVLVTADRTQEMRSAAEQHGIGVQHKPVKPAAIRAILNHVAARKRTAAA